MSIVNFQYFFLKKISWLLSKEHLAGLKNETLEK